MIPACHLAKDIKNLLIVKAIVFLLWLIIYIEIAWNGLMYQIMNSVSQCDPKYRSTILGHTCTICTMMQWLSVLNGAFIVLSTRKEIKTLTSQVYISFALSHSYLGPAGEIDSG